MNAPLLALGIIIAALGALLLRWPGPIYWLDEQSNLRWARWWGVQDENPNRRKVLWLVICGFLILFGVMLALDAFLPLQRSNGEWH